VPSPNNLNQTTPLLRNTVTAIIVSMTMNLAAQSASAPKVEEKQKNQLNDADVIIVTAPQHSPLVVVSSLKHHANRFQRVMVQII